MDDKHCCFAFVDADVFHVCTLNDLCTAVSRTAAYLSFHPIMSLQFSCCDLGVREGAWLAASQASERTHNTLSRRVKTWVPAGTLINLMLHVVLFHAAHNVLMRSVQLHTSFRQRHTIHQRIMLHYW